MDPKEQVEYTYSRLYSEKEFQIAGGLEDDGTDTFVLSPIDSAYAAGTKK